MDDLVDEICRAVAELPDRTSPDDWPDAMLVTSEELYEILTNRLAALKSEPPNDVVDYWPPDTPLNNMALKLAAIFDEQEIEDGRLGGAVTAYRAGHGGCIEFWDKMARAALAAPQQGEAVGLLREAAEAVRVLCGSKKAPRRIVNVDTGETVSECLSRIDAFLSRTPTEGMVKPKSAADLMAEWDLSEEEIERRCMAAVEARRASGKATKIGGVQDAAPQGE